MDGSTDAEIQELQLAMRLSAIDAENKRAQEADFALLQETEQQQLKRAMKLSAEESEQIKTRAAEVRLAILRETEFEQQQIQLAIKLSSKDSESDKMEIESVVDNVILPEIVDNSTTFLSFHAEQLHDKTVQDKFAPRETQMQQVEKVLQLSAAEAQNVKMETKTINCSLPGIVEHHPELLNWLGEYKCKLGIYKNGEDSFIDVLDAPEHVVQEINSRIVYYSENPQVFIEDTQNLCEETIAIFVDLSNVLKGGALKVRAQNLIELVTGLRNATNRKFVGGSFPSEKSPFWNIFKKNGFIIDFLEPVNFENRRGEQAVDDVIHGRIRTEINFQYRAGVHPPKIVILSGDGNENNGRTSFPRVIEEALLRGRQVELWSWRTCMKKFYIDFRREYYPDFMVHYFEDHCDFILQIGEIYEQSLQKREDVGKQAHKETKSVQLPSTYRHTVTVHCPPGSAGVLIGTAGVNVREIKRRTGCTINVINNLQASVGEDKAVEIVGEAQTLPEAKLLVQGAKRLVEAIIHSGPSCLWDEGKRIEDRAPSRGRTRGTSREEQSIERRARSVGRARTKSTGNPQMFPKRCRSRTPTPTSQLHTVPFFPPEELATGTGLGKRVGGMPAPTFYQHKETVSKNASALIGKGEVNVREISRRTGCAINVITSAHDRTGVEHIVEIVGQGVSHVQAKGMAQAGRSLVEAVIQYGPSCLWEEEQIRGGTHTDTSLLCPYRSVRFLIGKGGSNVKEIYRRTGCRVVVNQASAAIGGDKVVVITGQPSSIIQAKEMVQRIIQQTPRLSAANVNPVQFHPPQVQPIKFNKQHQYFTAQTQRQEPAVPIHFDLDMLICPLSFELLEDPVTTPSGHTYSRCAIEDWITQKGTCPVTNRPLCSRQLRTNYDLQNILHQYLHPL